VSRRYCEPCDAWTNASECRECGAPTVRAAREGLDAPTASEIANIRHENARIARVMRGGRCPTCGDHHPPDEGCAVFIGDDGPQDTRDLW
jgi:hypothetical protein